MTEYITKDQGLAALREYQMGGKTAKEIICAIPAADVRPVVRGKFEYRGQKVIDDLFPTYACSNCHGVIPADWKRKCNYCPNCGADMRET